MDDYEFEDQAVIQILCALLTSETYQRLANSQGERTVVHRGHAEI